MFRAKASGSEAVLPEKRGRPVGLRIGSHGSKLMAFGIRDSHKFHPCLFFGLFWKVISVHTANSGSVLDL
jgi:hypothetical protein